MKFNKYSFLELVNIIEIKNLMASFYELTGLSWALVYLDGNIMTFQDGSPVSVGWQDFCLNIHRENPKMLQNYIKNTVEFYNKFPGKKCYENGLSNIAVPIYIDNEYMASFFIGSFFLKEPDIEFLRKEARTYGFDKEKYLDMISKIPVFSEDYIHKTLDLLTSVANVIGELGLEEKKLLDDKQFIKEREKTCNFN